MSSGMSIPTKKGPDGLNYIPISLHPQMNRLKMQDSKFGTTPGGTMFGTTPGGTRIYYNRSDLMALGSSPAAQRKPLAMAEISGVTLDKAHGGKLEPTDKALNVIAEDSQEQASNDSNVQEEPQVQEQQFEEDDDDLGMEV